MFQKIFLVKNCSKSCFSTSNYPYIRTWGVGPNSLSLEVSHKSKNTKSYWKQLYILDRVFSL